MSARGGGSRGGFADAEGLGEGTLRRPRPHWTPGWRSWIKSSVSARGGRGGLRGGLGAWHGWRDAQGHSS